MALLVERFTLPCSCIKAIPFERRKNCRYCEGSNEVTGGENVVQMPSSHPVASGAKIGVRKDAQMKHGGLFGLKPKKKPDCIDSHGKHGRKHPDLELRWDKKVVAIRTARLSKLLKGETAQSPDVYGLYT